MGTEAQKTRTHQGLEKTQGITNPLQQRLYTLPQAAHYLGRSLWSMRELVWKGSIPIIREGTRIYIDINDMNAWIDRNRTKYV